MSHDMFFLMVNVSRNLVINDKNTETKKKWGNRGKQKKIHVRTKTNLSKIKVCVWGGGQVHVRQ